MYKNFAPPNLREYESSFYQLVAKITGVEVLELNEGCVFENDTFKIEPYRTLQCNCGLFDEVRSLKHDETCLLFTIKAILEYYARFESDQNEYNRKLAKVKKFATLKEICQKFNRPVDLDEPMNVCTCHLYDKWKEVQTKEHSENCEILTPNFWYKTEDIKIQWFKRFFRNAKINKFMKIDDFRQMIGVCLKSL